MKKAIIFLVIGTVALYASGCAVPAPYIPETVGVVEGSHQASDLVLKIEAHADTVEIGTPITFTYVIQNRGSRAYYVPRDPQVRFLFTYSNGARDNYLHDFARKEYFNQQEVVLLEPGQQLRGTYEVKTYYFSRKGITEFSAVFHCPQNTNPQLKPFWSGDLRSNGYGVKVQAAKSRRGIQRFVQDEVRSSGPTG